MMAKKVKIDVHSPFTLRTHPEGALDTVEKKFTPGTHTVSEAEARHYYTQIHATVPDEYKPDNVVDNDEDVDDDSEHDDDALLNGGHEDNEDQIDTEAGEEGGYDAGDETSGGGARQRNNKSKNSKQERP